MSTGRGPRILAIESSCDETAAAVVEGSMVCSSVVATQIELHGPFGGVVPELASRQHLTAVLPVVREAMELARARFSDLDAIAVTEGPGLVGALLVGLQLARGLALATGLPLHGIHHLEGHLFSPLLGDEERPGRELEPHVALLVSGGHTELVEVAGLGRYRLLGATRDDAAGEAYDKAAKALGLGYPGGPAIDRLAREGDPRAVELPRGMIHDGLEFSFSGLKTAVLVHLQRTGGPNSRQELADLCAAFQAAVVDVLVTKARRAVRQCAARRLHVEAEDGFTAGAPPLRYCGDNAAMIGAAAAARIAAGQRPGATLYATRALDELGAPA
jgi:N6-L-threonylcarbamoyladenine synthase